MNHHLKYQWRSRSGKEMGEPTSQFQNSALAKIADTPIKCTPNYSILDVAKLMNAKRAHCIIVIDSATSKMVGLVTAKDMAFRVAAPDLDTMCSVTSIMTTDPYFMPLSTSANEALRLMVTKKIRHLPLIDSTTGVVVKLLNITKCFYHAMIRLEKMADGARRLQCTFENLNEYDLGSDYGMVQPLPSMQVDPLAPTNEELFDRNIRQRKMRIANDIKRLISIMKQPELASLVTDKYFHLARCATLPPSASILEAAQMLKAKNLTAALICNAPSLKESNKSIDTIMKSDVIGIITTKDILFRVLANNYDLKSMKVARIMTPRPNFAQETMGIQSALRLMYEGKFLNLPIVNGEGEITGLANVLNLTNALLKALDLSTVESTSFPSKELSDASHFDIENSSTSNEESIGPAWNKFWGSLEEPLKSINSSEKPSRRSSYTKSRSNLSSEWRSTTNFRTNSNTSTTPLPSLTSIQDKRIPKSMSYGSLLSSTLPQPVLMDFPGSVDQSKVAIGNQKAYSTSNFHSREIKFKLRVKESLNLDLDGKIYRVKIVVDKKGSDQDLLSIIKHKIYMKLDLQRLPNSIFDLSYIDNDGDLIALDKNDDLEAALESQPKKLLFILEIKEKTPDDDDRLCDKEDHAFATDLTVGSTIIIASSLIFAGILLSRLWTSQNRQ